MQTQLSRQCFKCQGRGVIDKYRHVEGGECFTCSGSGWIDLSDEFNAKYIRSIDRIYYLSDGAHGFAFAPDNYSTVTITRYRNTPGRKLSANSYQASGRFERTGTYKLSTVDARQLWSKLKKDNYSVVDYINV